MKNYKDPSTNELYAYEADGSQDAYIKEGLVQITDTEAEQIRAAAESIFFKSLTYAQKRVDEYPPITDYIDGIVKGDRAQVQAYVDACLAVKAKYPKPA
jgi:hypothetical protein